MADSGLDTQKLMLDALHTNSETLKQINKSQGIYLVLLKGNKPELAQNHQDTIRFSKPKYCYPQPVTIKNKGGRDEIRRYEVYIKTWKSFRDGLLVIFTP